MHQHVSGEEHVQGESTKDVGIACPTIATVIRSAPSVILLVVQDGCPYCHEVLTKIEQISLRLDTYIVNIAKCAKELLAIVDVPAAPAAVEFKDGAAVRKVVGADEVVEFLGTQSLGVTKGN